MSDWKEYTLGNISRNISRRFDFNAYPNVVFINTGDVLNNKFLHCDISNIKDLPGQAKKAIKKGDILYSEIRPGNGRYLFVDKDLDNYVVSTKFMVIEPNINVVLPEFLFLLIISNETTEYFKMIAESRSGTFPQITFDSVSSLSLNIPDKETQQKILDIITPLDDKIELNTQINQTLEQTAQALFKSWFVDFDPVRAKVQALSDGMSLEQAELAAMQAISGKTPEELTALSQTQPERYAELAETAKAFPCEMVEVDGIEVPKGWKQTTLSEICEMQNGYAFKSSEWTDAGIPVIKIGSIQSTILTVEGNGFVSEDNLSLRSNFVLNDGDIVIGLTGAYVGKVGRMPANKKAMLNQRVAKFLAKRINESETFYSFIYMNVIQEEFKNFVDFTAQGSAQPNISTRDILKYPLLLANTEVHLVFEKLLKKTLDKSIFNSYQNEILSNSRDLLLPRLLNGKL
ncbi:restriction endonuclease subunit S [uncultured Aggregatibacter sp.]|uniref:restriction endonuclease subunit S n=1 Tax=uncultured Aggregatibacter sp. TaxID=470564 RepID=UPI002627A5FA|nr:restriction endonuclease subunit S [uncultured Aggregatibacter sp.]